MSPKRLCSYFPRYLGFRNRDGEWSILQTDAATNMSLSSDNRWADVCYILPDDLENNVTPREVRTDNTIVLIFVHFNPLIPLVCTSLFLLLLTSVKRFAFASVAS